MNSKIVFKLVAAFGAAALVGLAGCTANGEGGGGGGGGGGGNVGCPPNAGKVCVSITPGGISAPGASQTLSWATNGIQSGSCVASSTDNSFTDAQPDSGSKTFAAPSADGFYSYTLTCTDTSGATVSNTATLVVSTSLGVACPPPKVFSQFLVPAATVTKVDGSGLCIGCVVTQESNVIDLNPLNYAVMTESVQLLVGGPSLTVTNTATHFPAGTVAGFIIQVPLAPVLDAGLLGNTTITLINDGADTSDTFGNSTPLKLDLLSLLGDDSLKFVGGASTVDSFNGIRIDDTGLLNALPDLNVYGAGVCVDP